MRKLKKYLEKYTPVIIIGGLVVILGAMTISVIKNYKRINERKIQEVYNPPVNNNYNERGR